MTHRIAAGFLIDGDGRVLLGLRAGWKTIYPNHWDCIGGHIEAGESAEAALMREVREEVGVVPSAYTALATLTPSAEMTLALYLIRAWHGGAPRNCSDEHTRLQWFTLAELRVLPDLVPLGYPELLAAALQ